MFQSHASRMERLFWTRHDGYDHATDHSDLWTRVYLSDIYVWRMATAMHDIMSDVLLSVCVCGIKIYTFLDFSTWEINLHGIHKYILKRLEK